MTEVMATPDMLSEDQIITQARSMTFDEGRRTYNNFLVSIPNINSERKLETAKKKLATFKIAVDSVVDSAEALGKEINIVNVIKSKFAHATKSIAEKETELKPVAEETDSLHGFTDNSKVMDDDYFTASEHRFMTAVTETLSGCESICWEDNETSDIAPDVLTDWEYADYAEFEHQVTEYDFDTHTDKVVESGTVRAKSLKHAKTLLSKKTGVKGRWYSDCPRRCGHTNPFSWNWKSLSLHKDRHNPILWIKEA